FIFVGRSKQRLARDDIDVDARLLVVEIFTGAWALGAALLGYAILLRRQFRDGVGILAVAAHCPSPLRRSSRTDARAARSSPATSAEGTATRRARQYATRWPRIRRARARLPPGSAPARRAAARDTPVCPDRPARGGESCKAIQLHSAQRARRSRT